jgi:tetratricopeptide (TPR) repeat protein
MSRTRTALWLVAALAASRGAAAQEAPPADDAQRRARALHEQGMSAYDAGRYDEAATAFDQAYQLSPAPGLLFNLAQAQRGRGPRACPEALAAYRSYLRAVPTAPNRAVVEARIAEMEPCAAREEERRARASPASRPRKLRPAQPEPVSTQPRPERPEPMSEASVEWLLAGAGSGVVAAAIGTGLYLSAGSDYSELEQRCGRRCPPSAWEGAKDRERTGLVLIGVGSAVAVATLVVWLATSGESGNPARARDPRGVAVAW